MASFWPHIEEAMVDVLADLADDKRQISSRQIFYSIVNQQARIKIMRTLLEESHINKDRPQVYDEIIDEFSSLNKKRNDFLHSLWWVADSDEKTTWIAESSLDYMPLVQSSREIKINELTQTLERMRALWLKISQRNKPSPETHPPQRDDKN
jgi:hypothetical protein